MAKEVDPYAWACESLGAVSVVLGFFMFALALPLALEAPRAPNLDDALFSFNIAGILLPFAIIGLMSSIAAWRFDREAPHPRVTWIAGLAINGLALAAIAIGA